MKYAMFALSLTMLTACEKPIIESVMNEKPNIEIGMSVNSIEPLALWEIEKKGAETLYKLESILIFTKNGMVESAMFSSGSGDMPFTIEKLDSSNLNEVESYHNTERTEPIGSILASGYTKGELWLWYGSSDDNDVNLVVISNEPSRRNGSSPTEIPIFPPYDLKDMAKLINKSFQCDGYVESQDISRKVFTVAQKIMMQNISKEHDIGQIKEYINEIDYKFTEQECNSFLKEFVQFSDEELQRLFDIT